MVTFVYLVLLNTHFALPNSVSLKLDPSIASYV